MSAAATEQPDQTTEEPEESQETVTALAIVEDAEEAEEEDDGDSALPDYYLDLLPIPCDGVLTPEDAISWMENERQAFWAVGAFVGSEGRTPKVRDLGTMIAIDVDRMMTACFEAVRTGEAQRIAHSDNFASEEEVAKDLMLICFEEHHLQEVSHVIGGTEGWGFELLQEEALRRGGDLDDEDDSEDDEAPDGDDDGEESDEDEEDEEEELDDGEEEFAHNLQLLPIPEEGVLTPEAALEWLSQLGPGCNSAAACVALQTDDGEARYAASILANDAGSMMQAAADAIRSGEPQRLKRYIGESEEYGLHLTLSFVAARDACSPGDGDLDLAFELLQKEALRRFQALHAENLAKHLPHESGNDTEEDDDE